MRFTFLAALFTLTAAAAQTLPIEGPALYHAWCSSCHGVEGKGDGPMANSLKSAPPDLTRITARNKGMFPFERITNIIAGDEQVPGGHGNRQMPIWGPVFSRVDADRDFGRMRIDNLTRYLQKIQRH